MYALGATLYALMTGRPPFQAATPMDTVLQVISDEPVSPRRLNASIPRDLETICLKCLEKDPGKRYATAAALGEDLRRYLAGEPIVARPVTRLERAVKWARRKPAIAALLALVALVTALGLGGVLWQWRTAVRQTELAQRRLYDVQMTLVQRYWEDYNGTLLHQGLVDQLPANQGGVDRRGFEWFYWDRKMSGDHLTLRLGYTRISSLAYSPDGRRLASAGGDLKVWDAATGQEIQTLEGHSGHLTCVAFSLDGQRIAAGDASDPRKPGGEVKVWGAETGREIWTLTGHTRKVSSLAYSPDGQRLASAAQDEVKLWDTRTGQETQTFKGPSASVNCVAFSPDGRRLAFGRRGPDGVGRGHRAGNPNLQGAQSHRRVQPRRPAARDRRLGPDGEGVGRGHRAGNPILQGAQCQRQLCGVQPRRPAARVLRLGPDGEGVGRGHRAGNPNLQGAY